MSSLLSESDLNDFISPGLACVKPTETIKEDANPGNELEVGKESNELEKVSISLQDCLACSGCITSSEEILLSRQSHTVFLEAWKKLPEDAMLAVSIPPQCRLSLAHYYNIALDVFDKSFINLMKSHFKAEYVVGTQVGRSITINQTNKELAQRKQTSGTKTPALCAVCPGFVLYAEKTKPELVPFLLDVKSPQQITGSLLKRVAPNVYHLTVMPCFDKKLEASRKDSEGEVDCVITPRELVTMLQELDLDLKAFADDVDEIAIKKMCSPPGWDYELHWASNEGSGSGGYAYQYILHQGKLYPDAQIVTINGKNSDIREYRLMNTAEDKIIASSSELYGFRNIQNMVRKLTNTKTTTRNVKVLRKRTPGNVKGNTGTVSAADPSKTDFIEVMACPGGCINGGGLLNGEQNSSRRRALAKDLESEYEEKLPRISCTEDVDDRTSYKYEFTPIEKSSDVVTVGNTW
ncbi:LANO_0E00408g1_1 [Lachancea nothofagi CBS 11611]|uniref:Cytosolic Fe-S cluster assembly factor NAR1 n=1 Tax=Lachancea nothofagi CBS 11611 TaxID=1266666 RepID=A0A1G4JNX5_9SACH|nr:LANO_0E00408g1_1 [Lachancea nothofagi CBS 11611]